MSAPAAAPSGVAEPAEGLGRRVMSAPEVLAQSVAGIAPSAVMATGPALIAVSAGRGTWVSYAAATVVVLLVGYCVAQFAKRTASSGSLYSYVAKGLNPGAAFAAGIGLLIGYLFIAMGSVVGAGIYGAAFLSDIGIGGGGRGPQLVLYVVLTALAAWATIRGIKLSTRVGLVLEVVSISSILLVLVITLVRHGFSFDHSQLSGGGLTRSGITQGIVLAILGFVGFESASSLGVEARHPYKAIPRAVLWSAAAAGFLYILSGYTEVLGLGGGLATSTAPVNALATRDHVAWLHYAIDLGITASFFACITGSVNAATRTLFTLGREGMVSARLGRAHTVHQTPHVAVLALAPLTGLVPFVMVAQGTQPVAALGYLGTLGTFGYMLAYILVAVAAPLFLRRLGALTALPALAGPVAAAAMVYVFVKNVYPAPPKPYNVLPYLFLAAMVLGMAWYAAMRVSRPERTRSLGSSALAAETAPVLEPA